MSEPLHAFTESGAARVVDAVRRVERSTQNWLAGLSGYPRETSLRLVEGTLAGALAANGTATLDVFAGLGAGWTDTGEDVTVTDRAGFTGSAGAYCLAAWMGGEFRPLVVAC